MQEIKKTNGFLVILWFTIMLLFFVTVQLLFEKDRYLWLGLFSPVIEGEAKLITLSYVRTRNELYTIHLQGMNKTPDFQVKRDADGMHYYNLKKLYQLLKDIEPHTIVKVRWKKPWLKAPFYISVMDEDYIMKSDSSLEFFWLFLSAIPCFMVFIALRYGIFKKDLNRKH
ncbi:MAG: hypothetical protein KAG10_07250 [Methylococcales bacterium]|nr:hypothetical protein [Methylococcales bacterium]MCK5925672.1 hypothetical protein [Methylococcales bacterium]